MNGRRFAIVLGVIAIAALGIRVAFVDAEGPRALTTGDSYFYYSVAHQIADGDGYVRPYELAETPPRRVETAEHPPLYPLALAVPVALGFRSLHDLEIFSSFIGAIGVVLVALLGRKVAGSGVGIVAGVIAAVYPLFFQPAALLFAETLFIPLVAGALIVAYLLIERPTAARFVALGVLIGLAALTRGEGVLLFLGLAVPLAWKSAASWPGRLKSGAVVAVALVVVLAPWMIRNAVVFDRFVPISNNTSTAISGANCGATYSGSRLGAWDVYCVYAAYAKENKERNLDGQYQIQNEAADLAPGTTHGLDYMSRHLDRLPVVVVARVLRTWNLWNPSTLLDYDERDNGVRSWLIVGYVMFLVMLPLAIAGGFLLRRRGTPLWPLIVPVVIVTLMSVALHGATRFRQGAEPSIVVLASTALVALAARVAGRSVRRPTTAPDPDPDSSPESRQPVWSPHA